MRIIAGEFRSRLLAAPQNRATRPTTDRARETLFNVLQHLFDLSGMHVLDLYAGSGALGIEALSRGAASAVFIERDRKALASLDANIAALKLESRTRILRGDVHTRIASAVGPFDLILADAPYDDARSRVELLPLIVKYSLLSPDGCCVIEHRAGDEIAVPEQYAILRRFVAGEASFTIVSSVKSSDQAGSANVRRSV